MQSRRLATSLILITALILALPATAAAEVPNEARGLDLLDLVSRLSDRVVEWVRDAAQGLVDTFSAQEGASMSTNG